MLVPLNKASNLVEVSKDAMLSKVKSIQMSIFENRCHDASADRRSWDSTAGSLIVDAQEGGFVEHFVDFAVIRYEVLLQRIAFWPAPA